MKISAISSYQNNYKINRNNNNQPQPLPAPCPVEDKAPSFGNRVSTFKTLFLLGAAGLMAMILGSCTKERCCGCGGTAVAISSINGDFDIYLGCDGDTIHIGPTGTPVDTTSVSPSVEPSIEPSIEPSTHPVHIDDYCIDMFTEVLGTGVNGSPNWEGPNNIARHVKVVDWGKNQIMEVDVDTIRYNSDDTIAYNVALDGQIYDINNVPIGNGIISGNMEKVNLTQGQAYQGSNARYGVVISNPEDNTKHLYVQNNGKTAIFVFDWDGEKAKGVKVDPTTENGFESKPVDVSKSGIVVPEGCNVYFTVVDDEVYIYAKSPTDGQFYVKSAELTVTNRE